MIDRDKYMQAMIRSVTNEDLVEKLLLNTIEYID